MNAEKPAESAPKAKNQATQLSRYIPKKLNAGVLITIILLSVAAIFSWILTASPPVPDTVLPDLSVESDSFVEEISQIPTTPTPASQPAPLPPKKRPPPKPDVYWSVLVNRLLELEKNRVTMMSLIQPSSQFPERSAKTLNDSFQEQPEDLMHSKLSIIPEDQIISWTTVGEQLIELEQHRQKTISFLTEKTEVIQ